MSDRSMMFAPADCLSGGDLLRSWEWLVPPGVQVLRITACGDAFYRDGVGAVWFLDTVWGRVERVASIAAELDELLDDAGNRRRFLWSFVVRELSTGGKKLGRNECYSPKHPVHLGGVMETENLEPIDLRVHLDIMGQLHQQSSAKAGSENPVDQ